MSLRTIHHGPTATFTRIMAGVEQTGLERTTGPPAEHDADEVREA
jgi:hypothetical protein